MGNIKVYSHCFLLSMVERINSKVFSPADYLYITSALGGCLPLRLCSTALLLKFHAVQHSFPRNTECEELDQIQAQIPSQTNAAVLVQTVESAQLQGSSGLSQPLCWAVLRCPPYHHDSYSRCLKRGSFKH